MGQLDLFKEKFKVEKFMIYESNYWTWSLRPQQPTLGSGVLALKRYAEAFADITPDEGKDLSEIIKVIESRLRVKFEYEKINYLMLMMVDSHLHFHIIPRYSKVIELEGIKWEDKGWPGLPSLDADDISDDKMNKILLFLKK